MLFYDDNYRREVTTVINGFTEIDGKQYVTFRDNLFYPQGGGQKSDRGTVCVDGKTYTVLKSVKDENGEPIVCLDCSNCESLVGRSANCTLDFDWRYYQMKMHTCLHMVHCLIEKELGHSLEYPIMSSIEDTFAINKYKHAEVESVDFDHIQAEMNTLFSKDIPVENYADGNDPRIRYWKCMDYVIPCGGIHVHSLKEIGPVKIDLHTKKGNTSVIVTLL